MLAAISVQLGSLPGCCLESEEEGGDRIRQLRGRRRRLENFLEASARREGSRGSKGLDKVLEGSGRRVGGRGGKGFYNIFEGNVSGGGDGEGVE